MKQTEIEVGKSYLFNTTDVEHRKNMIGTVVTVVSSRSGKSKANKQFGMITGIGRNPKRYRLSNGQACKAAELKHLPQ